MPETKLLRLEEVAQRLAISYTQARMLVLYQNAIPYFTIGSRGIRVKEEDLEKYIAKQVVKAEEATPTKTADAREPYKGRKILGKEEA